MFPIQTSQVTARYRGLVCAFSLATLLLHPTFFAHAGGKIALSGIYMTPYGNDAKNYSRPGWGLAAGAGLTVGTDPVILSFNLGGEYIDLHNQTTYYQDPKTLLRVEQQTNQASVRVFVGPQVGGYGNGFLRPYAGAHVALLYYFIKTDVVVPNDYDREKEIRQNLREEGKLGFGFDLTVGIDVAVHRHWTVGSGMKYLKSFSVPQQLGEGSVRIYPQYFQVFVGVGVSFDAITGGSDSSDDE
jgi:opacity protein-like surface antigen